MKKITYLIMALLIIQTAFAVVEPWTGARLKASTLRYEPTPAEQGATIDIWVQLMNVGTRADNIYLRLIPEYPFSIAGEEEIYVGNIAGTETKIVKITAYIDPQAQNGEHKVKLAYKHAGLDGWAQFETPITVRTQNALVIVDSYTIEPNQIIPGQEATIKLNLKNVGRIEAKNVDATLDVPEGTFVTIDSGTKKRIDIIKPEQTQQIQFKLASDTATQVKSYRIPFLLTYQDTRNKNYNDTVKIGVIVNAKPEITAAVESTEFETSTSAGKVTLKIVNKGVANLKYVTVRIMDGEYKLLSSSNEAYVGNLDSDDFQHVTFLIQPKNKNTQLNIELTYKDPYNKDFTETHTLPLTIITSKDLGSRNLTPWIIAVLIIIAGAVYWKRK